jgi:hypothetical protein
MPVVAQIFVDGDSHQRYLVAVVVPEESVCYYVKLPITTYVTGVSNDGKEIRREIGR